MTRTRFDPSHAQFSHCAHAAARELVYPALFGFPPGAITYVSPDSWNTAAYQELDTRHGIDKVIQITAPDFFAPLSVTVQERFRQAQYADRRDITLTEFNRESGEPSELYKIKAQLFVYGYYDPASRRFPEVLAVNVGRLLLRLCQAAIPFQRGVNPKQQDFLCLLFDDLLRAGVVEWHGQNLSADEADPFTDDLFPFTEESALCP